VSLVLVAADAAWVRQVVKAACSGSGQRVIEVSRGQDVRKTVDVEEPDVVVLDMQIGNMGGIAVTIDLRLEAEAGRIPPVEVLLLLDREADRFLAKRADVNAVLLKPVDPGTLRRVVDELVAAHEAAMEDEGDEDDDEPGEESADDAEAEDSDAAAEGGDG
jgi:CheY-like chemotaxis protein